MWFMRRKQPVDQIVITRILVVLLLVLSMFGGYYYTKYYELLDEYNRLESTKLELIELDVESVE